jgi:hypothetical protein
MNPSADSDRVRFCKKSAKCVVYEGKGKLDWECYRRFEFCALVISETTSRDINNSENFSCEISCANLRPIPLILASHTDSELWIVQERHIRAPTFLNNVDVFQVDRIYRVPPHGYRTIEPKEAESSFTDLSIRMGNLHTIYMK